MFGSYCRWPEEDFTRLPMLSRGSAGNADDYAPWPPCHTQPGLVCLFSVPAVATHGPCGTDFSARRPSGKGYIDASTVSTAASAQIAEEVQRTGARFLEAPVSGSKQPAETGTLIFLTAGQLPSPTLSPPPCLRVGHSSSIHPEVQNRRQKTKHAHLLLSGQAA